MQAEMTAKIDRELAFARARWGETRELKLLERSRGDVLDDGELLRMLRYFWLHGTVYAYVIARTRSTAQRNNRPQAVRPTEFERPDTTGTTARHPNARRDTSGNAIWRH